MSLLVGPSYFAGAGAGTRFESRTTKHGLWLNFLGDLDKPFLMYVEDVFSISGRGTVVTGKVERGTINKGAEVEIVGMGNSIKTTLTGIGKSLPSGH